ncbi:hypothetical protein DH2020_023493 [Rehmannia glutinosa]|uniref:RRM domain-containing protein n=1 Tax=Rehmannia glutinosa TaxID=99300 RepID=A0ABR0WAJ7_REHGL
MEGGNRTFRVDFTSEGVSSLREVVKEKLKEFMGDYTDDTLVCFDVMQVEWAFRPAAHMKLEIEELEVFSVIGGAWLWMTVKTKSCLSEYVIVLLKNGRSKDEAKSELNVFLGDDDSDSFVSWLWDHLGSNLSLYVQPQELHPDGAPKTKLTAGDEAGKTKSHQIEAEAEKGNSVKTYGRRNNRESEGVMRDANENEVPLPRNFGVDNVSSQDEHHRVVGRTKPSLSPRPTIHKKRRRTEEQPRKREVSQSTVSAPRRLLQFAVRDAVATSRPSNATAEPSLKRLRSVVATSTGDLPQGERPLRIRSTSMSAAIKAAAEAVMDVSKVRPPRNVFDRLGHATDVSNTAYYQEHGGVAEDVGDGDFAVDMENFHSAYNPRNESSRLEEGNLSPFHDTVLDSDLVYGGEGYDDVDVRERETTDVSLLGTSDRNWVENSLTFQYDAVNNVDERLRRPSKDLGPPAMGHNSSLELLHLAVATKSEVRLMKENNNPTVAFNGNAKPETIQHQSEKTQAPTGRFQAYGFISSSGLHNTGPPAEDADSRTIFVSNVHFAATKDSLSRHFNKFGEVQKIIILTDPASGQPKGSAYIEFMRKEAAELALSLDGTSFMSRLLKIVRKSSGQPEAASVMTWPRIARASPFPVPRFGRAPFARGIPNLYRARVPIKPGARSFQWKRGADSTVTETSAQAPNSIFPAPTVRGLTYVRTEPKTNGSSGTA